MKINVEVQILEGAWSYICEKILREPSTKDRRLFEIEIEYDSNTTLGKVAEQIMISKQLNKYNNYKNVIVAFRNGEMRYKICDEDAIFEVALEKYLDPFDKKKIYVEVFILCATGRIDAEDGVVYYMHSNEGNRHNEPHVHISEISFNPREATISILTGKVLAGEMPKKLIKKAREKILANREFFIECWNTKTNGLEVDVNRVFYGDRYM